MFQPYQAPATPPAVVRHVDLAANAMPPWERPANKAIASANGFETNSISNREVNAVTDKLAPPELTEQERTIVDYLRRTEFSTWNPLAGRDSIRVLVIDGAFVDHDYGNSISSRVQMPSRYFDHAGINNALVEFQEEERVDVTLKELELGAAYKFVADLKAINDEIERTGNKPDAVNISIGISIDVYGDGKAFFNEWAKLVAAGEVTLDQNAPYYEIVRLAKNTNGPIFLSAGNSGPGTINGLSLAFPWAKNLVIVGANDSSGGRADYSSDTPHFFINGDLERAPVCDSNGMEGTVVWPGRSVLDFSKELPSYKHLEGMPLSSVLANDGEFKALKETISSGKPITSHKELTDVAFDAGLVGRLADTLSDNTAKQRLTKLEALLKKNNWVVDAATLYDLSQPETNGAFSFEGITGVYQVKDGRIAFAPDCNPEAVDTIQGTSFSSPKALNRFVRGYLEDCTNNQKRVCNESFWLAASQMAKAWYINGGELH
jgi:hypothetical protein